MERLQLKVTRLETLWSCLGTDPLSIEDKLKPILRELDKVLEYEEWQKQVLVGEVEDIMASIECGCQMLGISLESLNELDGMVLLFERKKTLTLLNNKLANEIRQRRLHIKEWLLNVDSMCQELGVHHSLDSFEYYHNNPSWSNMQKISCAMRDFSQKQQQNKIQFEQASQSIHYYWTILGEPVNADDPIDIALHHLCDSITSDFDMNHPPPIIGTDSPDHMDALLYYRPPLLYPLSLQDNLVATLRTKACDLSIIYNTRLGQFNHHVNSIRTLWEELKVPDNKRCTIHYSLHIDNLIKLQKNFDEMKTIVRAMTDEYIDTIRHDLVQLWDTCLLTRCERDEFMATLYHKANTMDTVHLIVDKHMAYLRHIQSSSEIVASIMKDRKDLIQKMIDFETSASDPKRLFQASFQLMEEERWRKTCFPTLLLLDESLIKAIQDFERISEKHFMVGNQRYLDVLMDEISDRTTNQTFFGFLTTDHDRSSKSRPNSLPLARKTKATVDTHSMNNTLKQRSSFSNCKSIQPSESTSPKRIVDTKKRNQTISSPIQQCKSKSFPVPQIKCLNKHPPLNVPPTTDHRQRGSTSPVSRPSLRSKTSSQIPVRAQMLTEQTATLTSQKRQQQHPFTVQCA